MQRRSFFALLFSGIGAFFAKLFGVKPKPKGYFIAEFKYAAHPSRDGHRMIIFKRSDFTQFETRLPANYEISNPGWLDTT